MKTVGACENSCDSNQKVNDCEIDEKEAGFVTTGSFHKNQEGKSIADNDDDCFNQENDAPMHGCVIIAHLYQSIVEKSESDE